MGCAITICMILWGSSKLKEYRFVIIVATFGGHMIQNGKWQNEGNTIKHQYCLYLFPVFVHISACFPLVLKKPSYYFTFQDIFVSFTATCPSSGGFLYYSICFPHLKANLSLQIQPPSYIQLQGIIIQVNPRNVTAFLRQGTISSQ